MCFTWPVSAGTVPAFDVSAPIDFEVGESSKVQAIAVADVDLDGMPDLVALNEVTEEISLFVGRADGSFAPPQLIGTADLPTAVAVADLTSPFDSVTAGDIDGNPDVVVADDIGGLQIFIGLGDGTFDPPDQLFDDLDTVEIAAVATADFNGDGRDDLALLEAFDGVYFLCNEEGTLQSCPTSVVFLDEFSFDLADIGVGDFNGGGLDVAVVDIDTGEMYPIFGNGDGTFSEIIEPVVIGEIGVEPRALRIGRIDDDELDDIVVLSFDVDAAESTLSVFTGATLSTQFARADYPAGGQGNAFSLDDFDGDGIPDAVVVGQLEDQTTGDSSYLAGNAQSGFDAPLSDRLPALAGGRVLQSGDLNGDGTPDLVGVVTAGTQIQVLLSDTIISVACVGDCDGNGSVAINELILAVNIALGNAAVEACTAADANGNGSVAINELIQAVNNALTGCVV